MAAQRSQHKISINTFANMADPKDQEFPPCTESSWRPARRPNTWPRAHSSPRSRTTRILVLMTRIDEERYNDASTVPHILTADFGSTPGTFLDGLQQANAAIQATSSAMLDRIAPKR